MTKWLLASFLTAALFESSNPHTANMLRIPSFYGVVEVCASIPGRMRLYIPSLKRNAERALEMKKSLEGTGAVRSVEVNFRLSTVLILYDNTRVDAAVVEGAVLKLMGLEEALIQTPVSRAEESIRTLYASINHGVLEASRGALDLRVLTGGLVTLAALRALLRGNGALPGAATLLWWASRILGGMARE